LIALFAMTDRRVAASSVHKHNTLSSRQRWAPVRQTIQQVKQADSNGTAEFCIAVTMGRPYRTISAALKYQTVYLWV